jgi:eukaryotic-like serine/threonine-protein kinase
MSWISDSAIARLRVAAEAPDLTGTGYRLLERVAHGGMGVVWLAHDEKLDRRVALKVLDIPLEREALILARLDHPGVVPVYDSGRLADGRLFYAMKYVEGDRLDHHVARLATIPERLRLAHRICETVAFAHDRGVLHRDLKPENIMVGPFGEVLVMDWGLAMLLRDAGERAIVAGTEGYMAPEQAAAAPLDERADVFSLGAILRFLVSGRTVDKRLRAIITKATATTPAARYAGAAALASDLVAYLDGLPVTAYRETMLERLRRFIERHKLAIGLVLAYTVVRLLIHIFFGA